MPGAWITRSMVGRFARGRSGRVPRPLPHPIAAALARMLIGLLVLAPGGRAAEPPAQRIIALAPNLVELVYAAGAGSHLVGVAAYCDFPLAARTLPVVSDYARVDLERVLALKPDLVLGWPSGNPSGGLARLRQLGIRLAMVELRRLSDVPEALESIGRLAGTESAARVAAADFRERMQTLAARYRARAPVSLFYQIWHEPLMTVGSQHLLHDLMSVCGARNLFGRLDRLTINIGLESLLAGNPELIVVSGDAAAADVTRARLRTMGLRAAQGQIGVVALDPDLLERQGPRLVEGAQRLCEVVDRVRTQRDRVAR